MIPTPHDEVVLIVDFGSQTAQLIARRCRELGVCAMMVSPNSTAADLAKATPKAIILSGGPASIEDQGAPALADGLLDMGLPVLGICYGMQIACHKLGAHVEKADHREFGRAALDVLETDGLLGAIPGKTTVWMSHGDQISELKSHGFKILARTPSCPAAAVAHVQDGVRFYGVQFHPEVTHTPHGIDILRNFLFEVAGCKGTWRMADFAQAQQERIAEAVGDQRVICGLSGGVDSAVCAALLHKAIGDQLTCVFVDTGLLRKNERELVETTFKDHFDADLRVVDAADDFLGDLEGITDPQEKRRLIGHRFIEVFKDTAKDIPNANVLAQGTLYPDVIESGQGHGGVSATIKLHHNVGGLPAELGFALVEPLRDLFKDEVRTLGEVLGLPSQMVWRHPFPGPGLAVRVLGDITREKLAVLRECDEIVLEEIISAQLYRQTSQVFAVLLPVQSVGVMGDGRTYENAIAVRAVESEDFMTADWARLPYDVLARISNRVINEVRGVNRVVYDISSKPPATIEWE